LSEHHNTIDTSGDAAPSHVSRRLIVKGAAWSVPAVAVASAVPAFAASTDQNLRVTATNCSLVTLRILSNQMPGFTYEVTEGTVPAGTQIQITSGGVATLSSGNFQFDGGLELLGIGSNVATFETQQDYTLGQTFTIGLRGLTVNVISTYTSRIITPDAVQSDDIAIMTAGGVGLGGVLGAFICFDPASPDAEPIPDLALNVNIKVNTCNTVMLLGALPKFVISAEGGTIPAGTQFLFYSTGALGAAILGAWSYDSGKALSLDLLGLGSDAAIFATDRDITPSNPLTIQFKGLANIDANNTVYLAYLGNDTDPSDNAAGMTMTGATVLGTFTGSCQIATQ